MFAKLLFPILMLSTVTLLGPVASANGFGITVGSNGKHATFGFEFTTGNSCEPTPPAHPIDCAPVVWVPAHCETVLQEVWVEGTKQQVWCAPVFEWRHDACGHTFKALISPGHWKTGCTPGHNETRRVQVFQPGRWQAGTAHAS